MNKSQVISCVAPWHDCVINENISFLGYVPTLLLLENISFFGCVPNRVAEPESQEVGGFWVESDS